MTSPVDIRPNPIYNFRNPSVLAPPSQRVGEYRSQAGPNEPRNVVGTPLSGAGDELRRTDIEHMLDELRFNRSRSPSLTDEVSNK